MAGINLDSIMAKVSAYSRTASGKKKMQAVIKQHKANGTGRTNGGSKIVTEADMRAAASKMIGILRSTAQSYGLPASVMKHFDSLECSEIKEMPDGSSVIYIYFEDDLHRDSLYPEKYDNGITNIIAMLNNGYKEHRAKDYVYGHWEGHPHDGISYFDMRSTDSAAFIRSRRDREGLQFIQKAILDFNGNYGAAFNVTAFESDAYLQQQE